MDVKGQMDDLKKEDEEEMVEGNEYWREKWKLEKLSCRALLWTERNKLFTRLHKNEYVIHILLFS